MMSSPPIPMYMGPLLPRGGAFVRTAPVQRDPLALPAVLRGLLRAVLGM